MFKTASCSLQLVLFIFFFFDEIYYKINFINTLPEHQFSPTLHIFPNNRCHQLAYLIHIDSDFQNHTRRAHMCVFTFLRYTKIVYLRYNTLQTCRDRPYKFNLYDTHTHFIGDNKKNTSHKLLIYVHTTYVRKYRYYLLLHDCRVRFGNQDGPTVP